MRTRQDLASERGAILVNVALSLLIWFGIGAFVMDYGVLWVARNQAQNAADAGALAGALSRAYDDFDDPPGAPTVQNVTGVVSANPVWAAVSAPIVSFGCPPEVLAPRRCVRTEVYRNGENGSTRLPTWFAQVIGVDSQGVKATATAQAMIANGTNCLRPWAIPDAWVEGAPGPDYRRYNAAGVQLAPFDGYAPPDALGPGTGFRFATSNATHNDMGVALPLTLSTDPTNVTDLIVPGWVVPLEPVAGYVSSVGACNGEPVEIGDQIAVSPTIPAPVDFGGLYGADSTAFWDVPTSAIHGSCAPVCAPFSPRLVAVAVFDTEIFQYRRVTSNWGGCPPSRASCTPCPGGVACATIVNIVGLFIDNAAGSSATLASYPGVIPSTAPKLTAQSSFLKAITLVR